MADEFTAASAIKAMHDFVNSLTEDQWKRLEEQTQILHIGHMSDVILPYGERKDNDQQKSCGLCRGY